MRVSGSDSEFSISLNLPKNKKYNRISVTDIIIPKSYTLIDERNNLLTYIEDGQEINISFDIGNYTVEQFQKRLSLLMTNNSLNNLRYTARMYKANICDTGRMILTIENNSTNIVVQLKIFNNISYLLGFDWPIELGDKTPIIKDFINDSLISEQTLNFAFTNNLYLTCNNCQSLKSTHLNNNNILTIIYNYQNYNSYYHHDQDLLANEKYLNNDSTNDFKFTLIDEEGQIVNLNNLDISFNLHIYYNDYEDITELIKNFIKFSVTPKDEKKDYLLVFNNNNN
jgi:hypothetical protein